MNTTETTVSTLYRFSVPLLMTLSLLGMSINLFVLVALRWAQKSRSPALHFTISLTVADTWVSTLMALTFLIHSHIAHILQSFNPACFGLCLEGLRMAAIITAVLNLLILAINQHVSITRPLHYSLTMTTKATRSLIVGIWLAPVLSLFVFFFAIPDQGFLSTACAKVDFFLLFEFRILVCTSLFIPLILIALIYAHCFYVMYHNRMSNVSMPQRRKYKAIITTALIIGTFLVGWMPAMFRFLLLCANCLISFDVADRLSIVVSGLVVNILILVKCIVDPVIYAARQKEMNEGIMVLLDRLKGRRTDPRMTRAYSTIVSLRQHEQRCLSVAGIGSPPMMDGRNASQLRRQQTTPALLARESCSSLLKNSRV